MTEEQIDELETIAKDALKDTDGLWEVDGDRLTAVNNFVAVASPATILELICEVRQGKNYISELEQTGNRYDKAIGEIAKELNIDHEDGFMLELEVIRDIVRQMMAERRKNFSIYSALEPCHLASTSSSVPPNEAMLQKR